MKNAFSRVKHKPIWRFTGNPGVFFCTSNAGKKHIFPEKKSKAKLLLSTHQQIQFNDYCVSAIANENCGGEMHEIILLFHQH